MDQIVTLETARLAEEVGFNGKVLHFYNHGENKLIPITLLISPPTPHISRTFGNNSCNVTR